MAVIEPSLPVDFKQIRTMFDDFRKEVDEDFQSPGISHFQDLMPKVKRNVLSLEQSLHSDKKSVIAVRDSLKELASAGDEYHLKMVKFAEELKRFGQQVSCSEPNIGNLFITYGLIFQQTATLTGDMMNSTKNVLFASLNLVVDTDLHGSKYKSYIDKNIAVYESAKHRVEREEKAKLRSAGQSWKDKSFQPHELAQQLEDDRRRFQLRVVEYMVKVVDVKTKRGVDFAEHLQGSSKSMKTYFEEGTKLMDSFKSWNDKTEASVQQHRVELESCRKKLKESQEKLKSHFKTGEDMQRHKAQTATFSDISEKSGYLLKKPDQLLNFKFTRRNWQKKYCSTNMMGFTMANSHTHPPSLALPPLSFKCNQLSEQDGHKYCFELFSPQRTYIFATETENDLKEWKAAMDNCMANFISAGTICADSHTRLSRRKSGISTTTKQQLKLLVKKIVVKIKQLPGNHACADCGSKDPVWLSVNLGILICLQCSGVHRNLSVQVSRIRSLDLDDLQTFELLIAFSMSNQLFNEVMEANVTDEKPTDKTASEERVQFIRNKYIQRKYIDRSVTDDSLDLLYEAVDVRDFRALLQAYAVEVDMCQPFSNREDKYTALHLAVEQEDLTSLHMLEFIATNSRAVNVVDSRGNTALHIASQQGMLECIKILLRNGANIDIENESHQTALAIVEEEDQFADCFELLKDVQKKKMHGCDMVNIDWGVDEEDEIYQVPDVTFRNPNINSGIVRSRPVSTINPLITSPTRAALKRTKSASPESIIEDSVEERKEEKEQKELEESKKTPSPPQRSESQDAIPIKLSKLTSGPLVPPKRKPKNSTSGADDGGRQSILVTVDSTDGPQVSPLLPPKPAPVLYIVEAQFDCKPDNKDELAFQEGDKIAVIKVHSNDWLRGYVLANPQQKGVIPQNYVKRITEDDDT